MSSNKTELEKRNILRLSNEESNKITVECIQIAFIGILSEKEIDRITVSEIVKKAGVSRSAFYRNFDSKEAILESISNDLLSNINYLGWKAISEKNPHIIYQNIFSRIQDDSQLFSLVVKAGFLDKGLLNIRDFLLKQYADYDTRIRYILFGWAGMLKNIILNWYLEGMQENAEAMSDLCCTLSESIVKQIENIDPKFTGQISVNSNGEEM